MTESYVQECNVCGAKNLCAGDFAACHVVESDYPEMLEIPETSADLKNRLQSVFKHVQKIRCEFMDWCISYRFAQAEEESGLYQFYSTTTEITLRPKAMMEMEEELIATARTPSIGPELRQRFGQLLSEYQFRAESFFNTQLGMLKDELSYGAE